jgi:hypothetical protein
MCDVIAQYKYIYDPKTNEELWEPNLHKFKTKFPPAPQHLTHETIDTVGQGLLIVEY